MNSVNSPREDELREIHLGLSGSPKTISPRYFYDQRGSILFEKITELPEYYLTRTELEIMREHIDDISAAVGAGVSVIEFGAGAGIKTKLLLAELIDPVAYLPVDISTSHLQETAESIQQDFPTVEVLPVVADFTRPFPLPRPAVLPSRNLVYFPGSTIGNFEPGPALELLGVMREEAGPGGALLIGIDLKKDPYIIEKAYNDGEEITAQFNLNVLRHLNREYDSDFDLASFDHQALYDRDAGRIEMSLVSRRQQEVSLGGRSYSLEAGERIRTEFCHKFSTQQFTSLAAEAGFTHSRTWTDPQEWFAIQLYEC